MKKGERKLKERVEESVEFLKRNGFDHFDLAIILGTGLGGLTKELEIEKELAYEDIPNFPVSTLEFHQGRLISGKLSGRTMLVMQGRFHYYEGYSMKEVTFPLYVMKEIGVKKLLISNAAGNLNLDWKKGDLMLIDDHINLLPENPLRGENDEYFGPRFPDMSAPYDSKINETIEEASKHVDINLRKGVYASVEGPNLESRAEYRYLRTIGADAVGMSTVPEVIISNYLGIQVAAISVLTDDCDPDHLAPANIKEILEIARKSEKKMTEIIKMTIERI